MCDIIAHYMLIGGRIMYILSVILVTRGSVFTVVSPKKGPWEYQEYILLAVHITLCSDGGRIFVILLHYTTKKRPSLHYHNLQQC